jgi:hypothetical protein
LYFRNNVFSLFEEFKVAASHNKYVKTVKNIADIPDNHNLIYKNKNMTVTEYFEKIKEIKLL